MKEIKLPQDDFIMPEETPAAERERLMEDAMIGYNNPDGYLMISPSNNTVLLITLVFIGLVALTVLAFS